MPIVYVCEKNFAEAHRSLVTQVLAIGNRVPTDYDKEDEVSSFDAPAVIEITEPLNPPIFSKCVYDSAQGLLDYRDEIVVGTHDHLADTLSYTYHDRFKGQVEGVIEELNRNPNTRRAQFITWIPEQDLGDPYPPCFQRGILRVVDGKLNFHTHWRSRDLIKAWGSNVFGFAYLHEWFSMRLRVPVGVYREFIDSLHIYGRDIEFARNQVERPVEDWHWTMDEIMRVSTWFCSTGEDAS